MSGFKSGVTHAQLAVSDKETAQAMMDTLKTDSGLFKADLEGGYIAPHFCYYEPTGEWFRVKDKHDRPVNVKSYIVTSKSLGGAITKKIRHFMGKCSECNKVKLTGVVV